MRMALIVDPSLMSRTGHHYNAVKSLITELENAGWQPISLISSRADPEILHELGAIGCFPRTTYDSANWSQLEYKIEADAFYKLLRKQLTRYKVFPGVIFLPTCDPIQLSGLARVIDKTKLSSPPQIAAWLLFPPVPHISTEDSSLRPQIEHNKEAFSKLKTALRHDRALHLFSETTALAETYQILSGQSVQLLSLPNGLQRQPAVPVAKSRNEAIHLVVAGHANINKGYELLPETLFQVVARHRKVRITVHGDLHMSGSPNTSNHMLATKAISSRITTLTTSLSTVDYYDLLRSADLIVLPYDPVAYRDRGSGIFTEATALGIPVVAPRNCKFAAAAIQEGRAIAIENHDAVSIANAISLAIKKLSKLRANAHSHAARLGAETSSHDAIATILESAKDANAANIPVGLIEELTRAVKYAYEKILRHNST